MLGSGFESRQVFFFSVVAKFCSNNIVVKELISVMDECVVVMS